MTGNKTKSKYKKVLTYNSQTNAESVTEFETKKDWISFLESKWKLPGEYNLHNTQFWVSTRNYFNENKTYFRGVKNSADYKKFWDNEKLKIKYGIIVDDFYISGEYYFYLNFCPIYDKINDNLIFPEIWDSDYHFFLYSERCYALGKHLLVNKKRQWGYSYKEDSKIIRRIWFIPQNKVKMICPDDLKLDEEWEYIERYRQFLNENTAWYRNFDPDKKFFWHQRIQIKEGNKKIYKGRNTILKAINTKTSPSRGVGGSVNYVSFVESGINATLDKSIAFITPNIKLGGVTTGFLSVGGSVGQLKECEPLRVLTYSPEENGFLGVPDLDNPNKIVSLFIPVYWNYTHVEYDDYNKPESERYIVGVLKCYDQDGNSDVKRAKELFNESAQKIAKGGSETLKLFLSQNPTTLDDLYAAREINPFNTTLVNRQVQWLESNYKPLTVSLEYHDDGSLYHKIINKDIVRDYPVKYTSYKESAIVIDEPPVPNPPFGLYIAGIDTIESKKTITSDSLMSIHIYKLSNEINGEYSGKQLVAYYTGRYENFNISFENCFRLIKYYNARAVIENNKPDFINYMIKKKHQHYILKRSELPILREITPNSSISEEYGVRTTPLIKQWGINAINEYLEEEIGTEFLPDGTTQVIYGVKRVKDIMLLKEILNYNGKTNADRIDSFGFALLAGKSYENRHVIVKKEDSKPIEQKLVVSSPFVKKHLTNSKNMFKLKNTFAKSKF